MVSISMKHYSFKEPLIEGTILGRPNRFIMLVVLNGKKIFAHCPSTGRIGNIVFDDVPCLLSKADNSKRKTKYTVEAIWLDDLTSKNKWVGINQSAANRYIEFFLRNGVMPKLIEKGEKLEREKKIGKSRIDFVTDNSLIEIKTLLITLPTNTKVTAKSASKFDSFDRLIKHFNDLSDAIKEGRKNRAVLLLCYLYDAPTFVPPKTDATNIKIKKVAEMATNAGVEHWQVNLRLDKEGVQLIRYFPLSLFTNKSVESIQSLAPKPQIACVSD
jgi:sugar fermentation stimulation protein A